MADEEKVEEKAPEKAPEEKTFSERLSAIEGRLDSIEEALDDVDRAVGSTSSEVGTIRESVERMERLLDDEVLRTLRLQREGVGSHMEQWLQRLEGMLSEMKARFG